MVIALQRRWIDPPDLRLTPAAGASRPATRMTLLGLNIVLVTASADGDGLATLALIRRHEFNAAVVEFMVVPLHKGRNP